MSDTQSNKTVEQILDAFANEMVRRPDSPRLTEVEAIAALKAREERLMEEAKEEVATYFITAAGGEVIFTRKMLEEMPISGQTVCREVLPDTSIKYWLELDMLKTSHGKDANS